MSVFAPFTDGCAMTNVIAHKYILGYPFFGAAYSSSGGRFGAGSLGLNNVACAVPVPNNPATFWCNFAYQFNLLPSSKGYIWSAYDATDGDRQVAVMLLPTGQMAFYLGSGVSIIGAATAQVFLPGVVYFFEIGVTIDPSAGSVELRLNGSASSILKTTGANTRKTSNSYLNQSWLDGVGVNLGSYSDITMFDSGGGAPNTWLGNKRVYTALPSGDSATGGLNAFGTTSPSQTSGNHYKNIDEAPPDGDTSYNADNTAAHRESYKVAALPSNASGIAFVNAWAFARIDDAGPHTYSIRARSSSTDSSGETVQSPTSSYTFGRQLFLNDPNTSSLWLPAGFNVAEFGADILS